MKTDRSISKSVLAIVMAGAALCASLLWLKLQPELKGVASDTNAPASTSVVESQNTNRSAVIAQAAPVLPKSSANKYDGVLSVIPISLTNVFTSVEEDVFHNNSSMKVLPRGTKTYGGIEFWMQGVIHLQGLATLNEHKDFRTNVIVPLAKTNFVDGKMVVNQRGKNIACIYILGGTRFGAETGVEFADLIWHYTDGTIARNAIRYNVDLRDWWRNSFEQPAQLPGPNTRVAWQGLNPARKTGSLRLYRMVFVNPHVERAIRSLEFVSDMARPSLFVAALTLDPLMPGARPDDLTSQEMADPMLNGLLELSVQDSEGIPLSKAEVNAVSQSQGFGRMSQKFYTDNNGMVSVRYPNVGLSVLEVSASYEDYSGRQMRWDLTSGDTVPASWTLKLAKGVNVGGVVVDTNENPVVGASVSLYRFWSGADGDPTAKGEHPSFSRQNQTTDGNGRWQAKGLPPSLLDHIGFEVTHPDFVGTSANVGQNATTEKQLREGTYKTVLERGQDVRGSVVDENNNPVAGAKVWAGRKFTRNRQQTTSDGQGLFFFHSVETGDRLFSVMAKGLSPAAKTITVGAGMPKIVFQLKAGSSIRGHVQDESGQPLAQARVGLEGNPGESAYDAYEFSASTDENGDFTWSSAPDEPMPFYIFHSGFESKRGVKLAPAQDNIITMHRSRTVEGLVLDDATEQPVTKFSIRLGHASPDNSDVYGVIHNKEFSAEDGRFSASVDEEQDNAVAVYAEGYEDKVTRFPEAQNGTVQVTVRLKAGKGIKGVVYAPDGMPAPGVNVAVVDSSMHSYIQLSGGRLRSFDSRHQVVNTDAQGRFTISTAPDDGVVVAAGETGFARLPVADVRGSGFIALQPWGKIEGTLTIGGQAAAGKDLLYNLDIPGVGTDFNGYKSTTDDQGHFAMEEVPPGEGAIVRLIKNSPNSWMHSDRRSVIVKAGETTQVSLGDHGAVLVGRIHFESPETKGVSINFQGNLNSQMPQMPPFKSSEEAQAYFKTPEYQALMKQRKYYAIELRPNGSFTVDDVAPGMYSLTITAQKDGENPWAHPPLGQGSKLVTVPDSFNPASPIDIGEVDVNPIQH